MCFSSSSDIILPYLVKNSMDRVSNKKWKDWEVRDVKKREKLIKCIGEQIIIIYIWKITFSRPGERSLRREPFVNDSNGRRSDEETVISASFLIYLGQSVFNIYTGKKCSEYLLERLQNTRPLLISFEEWTTWKRPDHPKEKHWPKKVLCALDIIHYIYTFSHSCPLSWLSPSPSTSTP